MAPKDGNRSRGRDPDWEDDEPLPARQDHYKLLGLENLRYLATMEEIKAAFKKKALEVHPDKAGEGSTELFKAVRAAYEILVDPEERRAYDSTDDFEGFTPFSERDFGDRTDCAAPDFFQEFGFLFRREACWSIAQPVPDFGGPYTPLKEVHAFYSFWRSFNSKYFCWHPDLKDLRLALTTNARRRIELSNAKIREAIRRDHAEEVREYVERAFEMDPRLAEHREKVKMAREKQRDEEAARAQKNAEKAEREAREAAEGAEAEKEERERHVAAQQPSSRRADRKAARRDRQALRKMFTDISAASAAVDVLCSQLTQQELRALNTELQGEGSTPKQRLATVQKRAEQVEKACWQAEQSEQTPAEATACTDASAPENSAATASQAWSEEELRLLEKGLEIYPMGIARRWELLSAYVRTRTKKEVVQMYRARMHAGLGFRARQAHGSQ